MRANRLPAHAGLRWIGGAFGIFRASPLRQLLLSLAFLMMFTVALGIPVVGFVLAWGLIPALALGLHEIARTAARGALPGWALLLAGFRANAPGQLRLGGLYLAGMAMVLLASVPVDDGRFAQATLRTARLGVEDLQGDAILRAMGVTAVLQMLLFAVLWYAPLLVGWRGVGALKASFFSTVAVLINWRAFLAYGAGMLLLLVLVMMLALLGARLFGGPPALQASSASFAVLWTLLPVWFASSYLSYRDVFGEENAADGEPPKSPTIPA
jgi:hypothetical protein